MKTKEKIIVLMSGGMDSTVCAAIAHSEFYDIHALHINYGQKTETREEQSFNEICSYYSIDNRLHVDIGYLKHIGGSSLLDNSIEISKADLLSKEIPNSYVPFRNANMLCIAVSWAEAIKATKIYIGAVQEDSSGYPDCRKDFFDAFQLMINQGTKPDTHIQIITPLLNMSKKEIIHTGNNLNAPLHLTWSCYGSEDKACGICDSCALRLRGFAQAQCIDPIEYAIVPKYL